MVAAPSSRFVTVDGLRLHYLEAGAGEAVLLLHGWPTSSLLWRNIVGPIAERNRVLALDLPGFGASDKPLGAPYDFSFHVRVLDGFLAAVGVDGLGLAAHDIGGPIGLLWACRNVARVQKLALLNTVVYPDLHWTARAFMTACRVPVARDLLATPGALRTLMRVGVSDRRRLTEEALQGILAPFRTTHARRALIAAGGGLERGGFEEIAAKLPTLQVPVRLVYGARDWILPDVARTMRRVQRDLPQAEVTALQDCGHFLQEDRPADVARLLADFFAA